MIVRLLPLVALVVLLVVSCSTTPERPAQGAVGSPPEQGEEQVPRTWNLDAGPVLDAELVRRVTVPVPSFWSSSSEAFALFEGSVHRYSKSGNNAGGLGRFVELEHESEFAVVGETQRTRFYTLYVALGTVTVEPGEQVDAGSALGTMADGDTGLRIAVLTHEDDPVWRRQSGRPPIEIDGYYFWDPSFVLSPP